MTSNDHLEHTFTSSTCLANLLNLLQEHDPSDYSESELIMNGETVFAHNAQYQYLSVLTPCNSSSEVLALMLKHSSINSNDFVITDSYLAMIRADGELSWPGNASLCVISIFQRNFLRQLFNHFILNVISTTHSTPETRPAKQIFVINFHLETQRKQNG